MSNDGVSLSTHRCESWLCAGGVSGLPQYEATKAYMPKDPDELSLQQAELVIVLQKEEGEALHVHTDVPERGPQVFRSPARVVLRGENERRRTGLVSCQLRHRNHQPHRHRKQRAAHEAPAQRDQRLKRPPSARGWWGERSMSTNARRTTAGHVGAAVEHLLALNLLFVAPYKTVTLKDNHLERTV